MGCQPDAYQMTDSCAKYQGFGGVWPAFCNSGRTIAAPYSPPKSCRGRRPRRFGDLLPGARAGHRPAPTIRLHSARSGKKCAKKFPRGQLRPPGGIFVFSSLWTEGRSLCPGGRKFTLTNPCGAAIMSIERAPFRDGQPLKQLLKKLTARWQPGG